MGGCLSSSRKDTGPPANGATASASAGQAVKEQTASTNPGLQQQFPSVIASEPAGPVPEARNGASDVRASTLSEQQAVPAAELSKAAHVSPSAPSPGPSVTLAPTESQGDESVSRTLAAGGTLLSPPSISRDPDQSRLTHQQQLIQGVNSSETGSSFQNPEGSAANASNVQPSGFQCMPAVILAKEVAQLSWVGHGGYGAVYKGVWQGANVAVKFTVADYMDFAGASAHEAVLSKMLSHPNVVQTFASRVALLDEDFLRSVFDGETNFPSRELPVDSFRSGEGFGSPYGINTSMKFRDVLTHIGARPGHYITQMIMEYCDRGSLHQAIAKGLFKSSSKWNNKIALRALLRTAREIAQGMSHLHACRVVHGDLKPGNVLLMSSRADRRGFTAKVSDFGLSTYCMASHTSVTRWSTVSYMAPEAFEGHLTMGSDTFSFGVLLWEMFTGQQPYAGLQAAQIVMGVQAGQLTLEWPPDSDPRIVELVEGCIQRNPAARPTFNQLIKQLTSLEAHIRLEAAPSDGTSEARIPLLMQPGLTGSGAGGIPTAGAAAPATPPAASPPPGPPPEAAAAAAAAATAAAAAAAADPVSALQPPPIDVVGVDTGMPLTALQPPPLDPVAIDTAEFSQPATGAVAMMALEEPAMPRLVPPPLPPEEEAEVIAAAAAARLANGSGGRGATAADVHLRGL